MTPQGVNRDNVAIVLHRPRYPENIGSAARAMHNMGFKRLVVAAAENCDLSRVLKLATHAAVSVVEEMEYFEDLSAALADFTYIVGTTARLGGQRQVIRTPSAAARDLVGLSRENNVALLFGAEDRGLTNEDIRFCHFLVTIPTADFSSLNLAQAVMIMCYELSQAGQTEEKPFAPRLARRHELEGMYDQLKDLFVKINYINPENPDYWMNNLRRFFNRMPLRAKEVSVIRGICRQMNWYAKKCYEDGLMQGKGMDS